MYLANLQFANHRLNFRSFGSNLPLAGQYDHIFHPRDTFASNNSKEDKSKQSKLHVCLVAIWSDCKLRVMIVIRLQYAT